MPAVRRRLGANRAREEGRRTARGPAGAPAPLPQPARCPPTRPRPNTPNPPPALEPPKRVLPVAFIPSPGSSSFHPAAAQRGAPPTKVRPYQCVPPSCCSSWAWPPTAPWGEYRAPGDRAGGVRRVLSCQLRLSAAGGGRGGASSHPLADNACLPVKPLVCKPRPPTTSPHRCPTHSISLPQGRWRSAPDHCGARSRREAGHRG